MIKNFKICYDMLVTHMDHFWNSLPSPWTKFQGVLKIMWTFFRYSYDAFYLYDSVNASACWYQKFIIRMKVDRINEKKTNHAILLILDVSGGLHRIAWNGSYAWRYNSTQSFRKFRILKTNSSIGYNKCVDHC